MKEKLKVENAARVETQVSQIETFTTMLPPIHSCSGYLLSFINQLLSLYFTACQRRIACS